MIPITDHIAIDPEEIEESFIRASGPGGQNVNKVSTAVQIRFNLMGSPSLPDDMKERAARIAGRKLTKDGVIVITAARFRTQERNREDAIARLVEILQAASVRPVMRRPTRPTLASKRRRLEEKTRRGAIKAMRGPARLPED
jgi:ribosome-associated protein